MSHMMEGDQTTNPKEQANTHCFAALNTMGDDRCNNSGWSRDGATGGAMELRSQDPVAQRIL